MTAKNRPISPHLQVYRPQLTSVLSVLHRASGILLAIGSLLIAWWFWSISSGGDSYATAHSFFNGIFGKALLFVWSICTFYHLFNGIRHLVWDAGYGYEISEANMSGKVVLVSAALLTILVWVL